MPGGLEGAFALLLPLRASLNMLWSLLLNHPCLPLLPNHPTGSHFTSHISKISFAVVVTGSLHQSSLAGLGRFSKKLSLPTPSYHCCRLTSPAMLTSWALYSPAKLTLAS